MGAKIVGIIDRDGGLLNENGFSFEEIKNLFATKNGKLATERMSYLIASSEIVIFIVLLFTLQNPIHYIIIFYFINF